MDTLRSYQDLPPVKNFFLVVGLWHQYLHISRISCFPRQGNLKKLLLFVQDKALAALAIEEKKRRYAAAEKYLEDVLHSALSTGD